MKYLAKIALCISTVSTVSTLAPAPAANAQNGETCDVAAPLDGQRLLRRLSLDLRGEVPSRLETEAQLGRAEVEAAKIDEYLESPEFVRSMRKLHEGALWPNIDQVEVMPETHLLFPYPFSETEVVYLSFLRAVFLRPGPGGDLYYPCKNEPARFDQDGNLIADPVMLGDTIIAYQEGWVEVEPYWAPGTTIRVCGFDAQDAPTSPVCPGPAERYPFADPFCENIVPIANQTMTPWRGAEVACDGPLSIFAPGCGCGANLQHCQTYDGAGLLRRALLEQEMRVIDRVIAEDRPYHEILTEKTVEFNGMVAHYLRYQSRLNFDLYGDPDADAPVPTNIPYSDASWTPVTRTGRHAGILTTPGYLLRFQTGRGRAHRFYNAFECSSFIPSGPLPSPFEECSKHEDLTQRCGCNACHQALEPMASHWGRFAEYGFAQIDDTTYPPSIGASCTPPFSGIEQLFRCIRFYEVDAVGDEIPFEYMLNAYVFRTPEQVNNIVEGPTKLARESVQSGRFGTCTARKMWTHFMRRQPTSDEEQHVLPQIVAEYEAHGQSLRSMVKAIVSHAAYRRLP